jgi:hypothetical protein
LFLQSWQFFQDIRQLECIFSTIRMGTMIHLSFILILIRRDSLASFSVLIRSPVCWRITFAKLHAPFATASLSWSVLFLMVYKHIQKNNYRNSVSFLIIYNREIFIHLHLNTRIKYSKNNKKFTNFFICNYNHNILFQK